MECKNCKTDLNHTDIFCANCGAKIIKNRLTFKVVFSDFFATFISLDNQLFKTFKLLLIKPESVIIPYIDGARKRFLRPFTYLLIALSFYGLFLGFAKDLYVEAFSNGFNFNNKNITFDKKFLEKIQKISMFTTKYFNFFMIILIPFYAFVNMKVFKKYNFVEHVVIVTYYQAETFIISTILISILLFFNVNILIASNVISPFAYIYVFYIFKRIYKLSFIDTLVKFLILILYFIIFLVTVSVVGGILIGIVKIIIHAL